MKTLSVILTVSGLTASLGWAAQAATITLPPVGPVPVKQAQVSGDGTLQVYSARELHDPAYLWDIFVGGNNADDPLYDPAHTDYTIYDQHGKVVEKVRNARGLSDDQPARVKLAPGTYLVKAEARDYGWVKVPVVVAPGQLTVVNLERDWELTAPKANRNEMVSFYGHRLVGWRADKAGLGHQEPSLASHP